jgi:hypothetical protein
MATGGFSLFDREIPPQIQSVINEVDAGGLGFGCFGRFGPGQLSVDDGINEARRAFGFALEPCARSTNWS